MVVVMMMALMTLVSQHDDYGDGLGCFVMVMTIKNDIKKDCICVCSCKKSS